MIVFFNGVPPAPKSEPSVKLASAVLLVFMVAMVGFAPVTVSNAQPVDDNCATCHLALGIANLTKPAEDYKSDIHAAKGFGCAACHGGDPSIMGLEGMDRKKGYIGKPAREAGRRGVRQVPCRRAHSCAIQSELARGSSGGILHLGPRQAARRSRKIKKLRLAPVAIDLIRSGRPTMRAPRSIRLRVADTCGSCHANKDYMASYKIPTDQVEKYKQSVHWKMMTSKGRSVGADLQRLPRQPRRRAAGSIFGGERLRPVPCG